MNAPDSNLLLAPRRPMSSAHTVRMRLYVLLLVADVSAIVLGNIVSIPLRTTTADWAGLLLILVPLFGVFASSSNAYSLDALYQVETGIWGAMRSLIFAYAMLFLIYYLMKSPQDASRLIMVASFCAGLLFIIVLRTSIDAMIVRRWHGKVAAELLIVDRMPLKDGWGIQVMQADKLGLSPDLQDPAMLDLLSRVVAPLDRVVVLCPPEARRDWAMMLKGAGVCGEVLVDDLGSIGPVGVGRLRDHWTLQVSSGPLTLRNRAKKRVSDLVLSSLALLVMAPALVMIAVAIKLDSPGPVLFRQRRVGRGNAFFYILKFRSMRAEQADADGHASASRSDDRITRVGRIIRRTSLDELPQLLNVFFGHMSIVGPRPHALGSLAGEELFWQVDERYWHRHALKPGITGLAQVRGHRGATVTRDDLVRRLQADLEYLESWSLKRDLLIMLRTFSVLVHHNTY